MPKLIIGCGYLGQRVAQRWLSAGHEVFALTRSPHRAEMLRSKGLRPIVADITDPASLDTLPAAETVLYSVGHDGAIGKSSMEVHLGGLQAVLDALPDATGRIIYTSSVGVYGQSNGEWVDEDSPCRPTREGGRIVLAAEQILAAHPLGRRTFILRLAGLYGPDRIPRRNELLSGEPIVAAAEGFLNLIHVDDAAEVVLAVQQGGPNPPRTWLVSDGHPVLRRDYFAELARLLMTPPPRFVSPTPHALATTRAGSDKRVANRRMLDELGVVLRYPSYREGLAASFVPPG